MHLSVKRYRLVYPKVHIILSTWDDTDANLLENFNKYSESDKFHIIINKKPDCVGWGNTNLQIISTKAGIALANRLTCTHVLKTRTDQIFGSFSFLEQLLQYQNYFNLNIPSILNKRIIVGSSGSFRMRPFCVSDFFSFGTLYDMALMWSLPLAQTNDDKRYGQILHILASALKIYLTYLDLKIGSMRRVQEITL